MFFIAEGSVSSTSFHKGAGAKYIEGGNPDAKKDYASGNIGITDLGVTIKRESHHYEGAEDEFGTEQIEGESVGVSVGMLIQLSYSQAEDENGKTTYSFGIGLNFSLKGGIPFSITTNTTKPMNTNQKTKEPPQKNNDEKDK